MSRFLLHWAATGLLIGAVLAAPAAAGAEHRSRERHWVDPERGAWYRPYGYGLVKAGGYGLDAAVRPDGDLESLFLGLEMGTCPSPFVQVGFTLDWLRRRNAHSEVVLIDSPPYDLPVQGVLDLDGTSTDLVPMGGILRLRYPVADGRLIPFVSGQLTYDLLRLEYHEVAESGGGTYVDEQSDVFHGLGTTLALGLEAALDPAVGLLVEAGVHDAEPTKELRVGGIPVDGRVDAGGEFARVGVRFGFR
jgi:hypothetical protein